MEKVLHQLESLLKGLFCMDPLYISLTDILGGAGRLEATLNKALNFSTSIPDSSFTPVRPRLGPWCAPTWEIPG